MASSLEAVYVAALVVALVGNGLALGLSHDRGALVEPLRRRGLLVRVAVLDAVALPLFVWGLVRAVDVPDDYAIGLILVGLAAAGPLGIVLTGVAKGDMPLAVALVVVLELVNLVAIPAWATLLLPSSTTVPVGEILVTLLALIIAPIVGGALLRDRIDAPSWARRLRALALAGLAAVVALVLVRDGEALPDAASEGALLVSVVAVTCALVAGWFVGGPGHPPRSACSLVTGIRASGPALAIAATSFSDSPGARVGIVVFALVSLCIASLTALALGRLVPGVVKPVETG